MIIININFISKIYYYYLYNNNYINYIIVKYNIIVRNFINIINAV